MTESLETSLLTGLDLLEHPSKPFDINKDLNMTANTTSMNFPKIRL
jgi:hypothetical protein